MHDQMVRYGDEETTRVAVLLRRNVFYEGEVMKLLEILTKSYEVLFYAVIAFCHSLPVYPLIMPHVATQSFHMPQAYMANCVVMTHAVLRQLEFYGNSGDRVRHSSHLKGCISQID